MDGANRTVSVRSGDRIKNTNLCQRIKTRCNDLLFVSGREWSDWSSELRIPGDELKWKFISDGSVNGWGWRFTVYPIMPAAGELLSLHATYWNKASCEEPYLRFCLIIQCFETICALFIFSLGPKDLLSDRCILSCPSMDLVTCLLDFRLNFASNRSIVPRLAASLAACAQLSALGQYNKSR